MTPTQTLCVEVLMTGTTGQLRLGAFDTGVVSFNSLHSDCEKLLFSDRHEVLQAGRALSC